MKKKKTDWDIVEEKIIEVSANLWHIITHAKNKEFNYVIITARKCRDIIGKLMPIFTKNRGKNGSEG